MPEKRPFERLPADVSPINYSLCLKPDLLDFTFEGKLEASAQVRRPSGAGGELPGKQLGRARGLGWGRGDQENLAIQLDLLVSSGPKRWAKLILPFMWHFCVFL